MKILFNTQFHWPYSPVEYLLGSTLRKQGHEVLMLACGGGIPHYCEQMNNKTSRPPCDVCKSNMVNNFNNFDLDFTTIQDLLHSNDFNRADKLAFETPLSELRVLEISGVEVGKISFLNLFQYYHSYPFIIEGEFEVTYRKIVHSAVLYTLAKERLFLTFNPDIVVTTNGKFIQWAPLVYLARSYNKRLITWEDLIDYKRSTVIFASNSVAHEQRIDSVWDAEKLKPIGQSEKEEVLKHFNLWQTGVFTTSIYIPNAINETDTIIKNLKIEGYKKIVSLYPNVSWDSTSVGYDTIFESIYTWIFETIEFAPQTPDICYIIRVHPGEKRLPPSYKMLVDTGLAIDFRFKEIPHNVRIIQSENPISSYALAKISDVNVVYTSTLALEFGISGIAVWVVAEAYYRNKGFTIDIQSKEEYFARLLDANFNRNLSDSEIELAFKFSHIVRLRRLIPFPYLVASEGKFNFPGFDAMSSEAKIILEKLISFVLHDTPFLDIGNPSIPLVEDTKQSHKHVEIEGLTIYFDDEPAIRTEINNIFNQSIYRPNSKKLNPVVIDGGAHVGSFSLYIKKLYPNAKILAFEPDNSCFQLLKKNLDTNSFHDVQCINKGLYNIDGEIGFKSDGADGSAISQSSSNKISVTKLSDFINEPIDFLKLNIEGAELEVLRDIESKLSMVDEIVIEYHGFPELGQRLHLILEILNRKGFRYLIHDFDATTNPASKPPFCITQNSRFFLLIYAKNLQRSYVDSSEIHPLSRSFGFDRGTPIDRRYFDIFLNKHSDKISGKVLEIGEKTYSSLYGKNVTSIDVLHVVEGNPEATIIGDLEKGIGIPKNTFDCIILMQTLHVVFDFNSVLRNCFEALKDNGKLILTAPCISQISRYDMDRWGDYWRFTNKSLRRVLQPFTTDEIIFETYGNFFTTKEFLNGRAAEELPPMMWDYQDPDYQLVHCVVATKKKDNRITIKEDNQLINHPQILLYHRVSEDNLDSQLLTVSPSNFRSQLSFLKNNFKVISLEKFIDDFKKGCLSPNSVAITFDDGYHDNYKFALPIIEEIQVPVTFFVTAGFVDSNTESWWDELERIILLNPNIPKTLNVSSDEGIGFYWERKAPADIFALWEELQRFLIEKPYSEIQEFLGLLKSWLISAPEPRESHRFLTSTELHKFSQSPFVEIGSHTITHSRLSKLSDKQQQVEISDSQDFLSNIVKKDIRYFSYPFGTVVDFNSKTINYVKASNYEAGMANTQGFVSANDNLFTLPRLLVRNWSKGDFIKWLSITDKSDLEQKLLIERKTRIINQLNSNYRSEYSSH